MNKLENASYTLGYLSSLLSQVEIIVERFNPKYVPVFKTDEVLKREEWKKDYLRGVVQLYLNVLCLPKVPSRYHPAFKEVLYQFQRITLPDEPDLAKWREGNVATNEYGKPFFNHNASFGWRLAAIRQIASVSQTSLALLSGLPQPSVARWERLATPRLNTDNIILLADTLHCSPELLMQFETE